MSNPLRQLAVSHSSFDGQVVWYMLPFDNLQLDVILSEFQRLEPPRQWRSTVTGEVTTTEPDAVRKEREAAVKTGIPIPTGWEETELWSMTHNTFVWLECVVDVEFHLSADAPAELRAFQQYRNSRNGSTANNWMLYRMLCGTKIINEFWAAYNATRDTSMQSVPPVSADEKKGEAQTSETT